MMNCVCREGMVIQIGCTSRWAPCVTYSCENISPLHLLLLKFIPLPCCVWHFIPLHLPLLWYFPLAQLAVLDKYNCQYYIYKLRILFILMSIILSCVLFNHQYSPIISIHQSSIFTNHQYSQIISIQQSSVFTNHQYSPIINIHHSSYIHQSSYNHQYSPIILYS